MLQKLSKNPESEKMSFVVVYRYRAKKENIERLKMITKQASAPYERYGWGGRSQMFTRDEGKVVDIMYLEYYRDQQNYEEVMKNTSLDQEVLSLRKEFDRLIMPGSLTEEFYDEAPTN